MNTSFEPARLSALMQLLKRFNSDLGDFVHFSVLKNGNARIHLENGFLDISPEELDDALSGKYSEAQLVKLSLRIQRMEEPIAGQALKGVKKMAKPLFIILAVILTAMGTLFVGLIVYEVVKKPQEVGEEYQELLIELSEMELKHPVSFLSAYGEYRRSYYDDLVKVPCTIQSTALKAAYSDIVIEVDYLSKTGTVIQTLQYVIYDFIEPGAKIETSVTIENPSNSIESVDIRVLSAKADESYDEQFR